MQVFYPKILSFMLLKLLIAVDMWLILMSERFGEFDMESLTLHCKIIT